MKINVTQGSLETFYYSNKWQKVLAMNPAAYLIVEMWNDEMMHVVGLQVKQPTIAQTDIQHPDNDDESRFYMPFVGDHFLYMDGPFADRDPERIPNTSFTMVGINLTSVLQQIEHPDYDPANIFVIGDVK